MSPALSVFSEDAHELGTEVVVFKKPEMTETEKSHHQLPPRPPLPPSETTAATGTANFGGSEATGSSSSQQQARAMFLSRSIRLSMSRGSTEWHRKDYEELCKRLREINHLECIQSLLNWDEQVMMPEGASHARGEQRAVLEGVVHDKWADPALRRLLETLLPLIEEGCDDGPSGGVAEVCPYERAVVRDAWKRLQRKTALPKSLAQELRQLESQGHAAWMRARKANSFEELRPVLERWVELIRKKCTLIDPSKIPYDVCLEEHERGMTSARLDGIFAEVKEGLVPLLEELSVRGHAPDASWIKGSYDTDIQAKLCLQICEDLGFLLEQGRLDVSGHPFTSETHPTDIRITTRFKPHCLMEGIQGAIHETGHALYEQGRNMDYDGLPVSEPLSTGVHEGQSLLWERCVGLSRPFCAYVLPLVREHFPEHLPAEATPDDLYHALNVVQRRSLLRSDADEVTYPLHIVLRYELERDLVNGEIEVVDLPRLWRLKQQSYLGCSPTDDVHGVLQDVHWAEGLFGYFPTYTLGAMYACQLFEAARGGLPELESEMAAGRFSQLRDWLYREIHQVGSLYDSGDKLMETVTGMPLQPFVFLEYLRKKYRSIYKLSSH